MGYFLKLRIDRASQRCRFHVTLLEEIGIHRAFLRHLMLDEWGIIEDLEDF